MGRALGSFGIYGFLIHKLGGSWLTVVFGGLRVPVFTVAGFRIQGALGFRV